ncbi:primase alpha helix C-terminal domain-containing protein [Staphylococcus warneri]|uniref:primase alpha helix C-terminal domain-containing protein n=1 Tax=Staphylococcus TaxID=1279 RepID=UPI0003176475|nr:MULTISPECIES: primase alpha helix C-terminal domain-containing protein [Staphylococcus]KAB2269573.1 mobile element-associated protein [Staphylococcus epidermidis]MBU5608707.1 primase alpha helix C-terminal domain-containing protein [Staphylococcus epidermidis]MCD8805079.1 primase alpha helix C-terminal domain-containing protein [Staphylococcus warneri]MCD8807395.1 primase alpha helix C-terminal domain-containing protein [Staphylococcus warneri]MCO6234796.1 primase alpha helix C-terminal dom
MEFQKVKLNNDFKIHIVQYKNLYSNSCNGSGLCEWSKWLDKLQTPRINSDKYIRGLCVYGDFEDVEKDNQTISKYRSDDTLLNRSAITLDYDEIKDFRSLFESFKAKLENVAWAFHTTYSYTSEKPRIRLIVPLNALVSASDYRKYSNGLAKYINYPVDEASFVPSQAMALPVKKSKDSIYIFKYNDAPAITIEELNKMVVNDEPITVDYSSQFQKRDSAYWREIAFGVGKGERNQTLASLTGYLLRRYVDANLVYGLVSAWAMTCRPPIKQSEVNRTFKSILKKDSKNK